MKEIVLKSGLTIAEMVDKFKKQSQVLMPGDWTFVGIRFYLVNEKADILATPGIYSKGYEKEEYEQDGE